MDADDQDPEWDQQLEHLEEAVIFTQMNIKGQLQLRSL